MMFCRKFKNVFFGGLHFESLNWQILFNFKIRIYFLEVHNFSNGSKHKMATPTTDLNIILFEIQHFLNSLADRNKSFCKLCVLLACIF